MKSRRVFQKTKSTEPINQAPGNLPGACAVHRLRRCTADDGVNPMETVRSRLYRFPPFFLSSRRMAPIVLSLRICLAMENLLPARLKRAESELNANRRFADLNVVLISNFKLKFQLCNIGEIINIEFIGDFDIKHCEFAVQEGS